jgi:hypothetical protein
MTARMLLLITFEDQFRQLPLYKGGMGDFPNLENGLNSITFRQEDTHKNLLFKDLKKYRESEG